MAWVEKLAGKGGTETGNSAIYVSNVRSTGATKQITANTPGTAPAESGVAWSPDSKNLAFLSDALKPRHLQLYAVSADGGTARKLTSRGGFLVTPGWSRDGKAIAVLFTENATSAAGTLVAATPERGVIKDAFFERRLALIDVANGKLRQITPPDSYICEYD